MYLNYQISLLPVPWVPVEHSLGLSWIFKSCFKLQKTVICQSSLTSNHLTDTDNRELIERAK